MFNKIRVLILGTLLVSLFMVIYQSQAQERDIRPDRPGEVTNSPVNGPTILLSTGSGGAPQGNGESKLPVTDGSARIVAFQSAAANLVANDTNGATDIFTNNTENGNTRRVSVGPGESQGNFASESPAISSNGQFVAFHSFATNLVGGDTNNVADVFIHDRNIRQTALVSKNASGVIGNDISYDPSVSADGRYVAYWSYASNLVSNDSNDRADVFVYDRSTGTTQRISVNGSGVGGNGNSSHPEISDDGRYVVYQSKASNLVAGDGAGYEDVFLYDRNTNSTTRISVRGDGSEAQGMSFQADISGNGRYIVYTSLAANLIDGDNNGQPDVFMLDRNNGLTYRVSVGHQGQEGNGFSEQGRVSNDGPFITFRSNANNLVPDDTNNIGDVFLRDFPAMTTTRASVSSSGAQGNDSSNDPDISPDGRYVVFASKSSNLVDNDLNGTLRDTFRKDRQEPPPPPPPTLTVNVDWGAPGSYFTVNGHNYPPNLNAAVFANGFFINPSTIVNTTDDGNFEFQLRSDGAQVGGYVIQVGAGDVTLSFPLLLCSGPSCPIRPQTGGGPNVFIPAGIALDRPLYTPIIHSPP